MRYLVVLGVALLGVCVAQKKQQYTTPVPILKQINKHNEDGSYSYGYEAADGTYKIETKYPDGEVFGKYGYIDDTGSLREVEYGASRRGFEPAGTDITVAPPTLKKSNEYPVALRPGDEDDGQYREDPAVYYNDNKYNQPAYKSYQRNSAPQSVYNTYEADPVYEEPEQPQYRQPVQYQRAEPVYRPRPTPKPASSFDLDFDNFRARITQPQARPAPQPQYYNPPPQSRYNPPQPAYNPPQPAYNPPQPAYNPPQPAYNPPQPTYNNNNNNNYRNYVDHNSFNHNPFPAPFNIDLNTGSYSVNY